MRKPSPALLVTSVVIALTGSVAFAQSMSAPRTAGSGTSSTAPSPSSSSARASSGTSTPASTSTNTSSNTNRTGSGNANIGSNNTTGNGSTSTIGTATLGNPTVVTNVDGSKTSTTLNADGSRTIVTMNLNGSTTTQNLPSNLFNPSLVNGASGGVTVDGERMLDERDQAQQINRSAASTESQGTATAEVLRSSASLDRVIRTAEKDRRKIGKNGQLLNSIAPRTNVDRTDQMRDDGPTPALSGLANSLSPR